MYNIQHTSLQQYINTSKQKTSLSSKTTKYLTNNLLDSQKNGKGAAYYVATEMKDKGYKFCKLYGVTNSGCLLLRT